MKIDRFEDGFDSLDDRDKGWDSPDDQPPPDEGVWDDMPVEPISPDQAIREPLGGPQAAALGAWPSQGQKTSKPFVKGPLCREWFVRAAGLRKAAVVAGMALRFRVGVTKDHFLREKRAESNAIRVDRGLKKAFGISSSQLSRGLNALANAGLIVILKGGAGRCPVVVIVNVQIPRNSNRRNPK